MKRIVPLLTALLLSACAMPVSYSNVPLSPYDKDTDYGVEENEKGFLITVYYSRYQFLVESDAVAVACKSQLTAIAWEHSDKVGRPIKDLNEQRIRISMGRNELTGITSCQAYGVAEWAE
jgi:hypothetical protein